jgi:hypothetical protein
MDFVWSWQESLADRRQGRTFDDWVILANESARCHSQHVFASDERSDWRHTYAVAGNKKRLVSSQLAKGDDKLGEH